MAQDSQLKHEPGSVPLSPKPQASEEEQPDVKEAGFDVTQPPEEEAVEGNTG